jgi:Bacteriodetes cell division protein (FtsL-like)
VRSNRFKSPYQAPQPPPSNGVGLRGLLRRVWAPLSGRGKGVSAPRQSFWRRLERNFGFAVLLALLAGLYIWNAHRAEKQARAEARLRDEIKELRSDYMTRNARISVARQQTSIRERADSLGLIVPEQPPFRLNRR